MKDCQSYEIKPTISEIKPIMHSDGKQLVELRSHAKNMVAVGKTLTMHSLKVSPLRNNKTMPKFA